MADKMSWEMRDFLRQKFDKMDAKEVLVALASSAEEEESLQVIGESGAIQIAFKS